ncbi:MAG: type III PLP-dependent enzyme [Methyloligellaceae bacterium]
MDRFSSAAALLRDHRPQRPVLGLRPHAAARAARWFRRNFPGTVVYALKANNAPAIVEALVAAGIGNFDVASLDEIERASGIAGAELSLMNPVKSRETIRRAYFEFGIRIFALDSAAELEKIRQETEGARDLTLFLRLACANADSLIPLEDKYGVPETEAPALLVAARQAAARLGVTFHVGSQAMSPAGFAAALDSVGRLIRASGVLIDAVNVGGGFPSRYAGTEPPALTRYMQAVRAGIERLAVGEACAFLCEPGRALVAEAESALVRVDARKGRHLYINDGAFGTLYDAAHSGFTFPARLVRPETAPVAALEPFTLYGPTCDSIDVMPGPFLLPGCIGEGDHIEIGQIGAYGRVMATCFNGFGRYDEAIFADAPMLTAYAEAPDVADGSAKLSG